MKSTACDPETKSLKLQAFRIGDLGIAAIPCEVFAETGPQSTEEVNLQVAGHEVDRQRAGRSPTVNFGASQRWADNGSSFSGDEVNSTSLGLPKVLHWVGLTGGQLE